MNDKEKKHIVLIDLTKNDYSNAVICNESDLIHVQQMERINKIWERLYQKALEANTEVDTNLTHKYNTISIFANRGAGKTTFLHSFLKQLKAKPDVLCLEVIDPSLIENKQHPFVNIIADINCKVMDSVDMGNIRPRPSCNDFDIKKAYTDSWRELLKSLSFMDGVGKKSPYEEWDDEEYVSMKGMTKAESCNKLEENFVNYVKNALILSRKKCIVVPFDDIDTDFNNGFKILEVIRRYLNIAQIIPVLTGDLDLYSKLIRKEYWNHFSKAFLDKEIDLSDRRKEGYTTMINQLENQYIVKLFKQENRVHLKNLSENLLEDGIKVMIRLKNTEEPVPIRDVYRKLCSLIGYETIHTEINENIISFLLRLSLRVQIRILMLMDEFPFDNEVMYDADFRMKFSYRLMDIFRNDVNQKASNAKRLMKQSANYVIEMLRFLVNNKALFVGSDFLPETSDHVLNKALFAVGLNYNTLAYRHNYFIFDYWLRISYFSFISRQIGSEVNPDAINDLLKFTQFDTEKSICNSVGLSQAYINSYLNNNNEEPYLYTVAGTIYIEDITSKDFNLSYLFTHLPLVGTIDSFGSSSNFLSIYKLLAVISESVNSLNQIPSMASFKSILVRNSQYDFHIEPTGVQYPYYKPTASQWITDIPLSHNDKNDLDYLTTEMHEWSTQTITVSAQLLDRIFTRFYQSMIAIDQSSIYSTVGQKFSAYISALLNATLVECALDNMDMNVDLNNVGDMEIIFVRNVNNLVKGKYYWYPLYDWLLECPLLRSYMNPFLLDLIGNKLDEKEQSLDSVLAYQKIKERYDTISNKRKSFLVKTEQYRNILSFLDDYKKLHGLHNDLKQFYKLTTDSNKLSNDSLNELIDNVNKTKAAINELESKLAKPLYIQETDYELNLSTPIEQIEKISKIINERMEDNQINQNLLSKQLGELEKKKDMYAGYIKEDFVKRLEELKTDKVTVYHSLCKIPLSKQKR